MPQKVVFSFVASGLALSLLFGAAQGAMPIPDVAQGVEAGTLVTPVQSAKARCWPALRDCRYQCRRQHKNPTAYQNCIERCGGAYRRCIGR